MTTYTAWQRKHVSTLGPAVGVTFADVEEAATRIANLAIVTPIKRSFSLSAKLGSSVYLKLETAQPTGAFKLRGAANFVLSLDEARRRRGVITVSTGNHGRAVAYVARELGMRCVVCLSTLVPDNKVESIRSLGAEMDIGGPSQDAALARALSRAEAEGLSMVSPFDDAKVISGQGTIAPEIVHALEDVGTILVPLSGGGLAAGVAVAAKTMRPSTRIVGISSEKCPAMLRSLEAGRPVEVDESPSLADSLGGGIGLDNRLSYGLVQKFVDEIQLVSDEEIASALRFAFHNERLVLEGAAAAPLAALLRARCGDFAGPIVAVVTGDNIDTQSFVRLLNECEQPS